MSSYDGSGYFTQDMLTPWVTQPVSGVSNPPAAPIRDTSGVPTSTTGAPTSQTIGYDDTGAPTSFAGTNPGNISVGLPAAQSSAMPDDAQLALSQILSEWGLGALSSWAWGMLTDGASNEQIMYELRKRSEYQQRFKGNGQRTMRGLTPLSEAEYLAYEDQARQMFKAEGLPANLFDTPDDFVAYIGGDTSIVELRDRIGAARQLVYNEPFETRQEYRRLFGTTEGHEIAMILDPTRALPVVQREIEAAAMAGAGRRAGLDLSLAQAGRVGDLTQSVQEAAQGFAAQARASQLFNALPGSAEDAFSADDQIEAVFSQGSEQARRLDRRQRQRTAAFQGSGGFLTGNEGASGTGVAR